MRVPNQRPKCAWVFCLVLLLNFHLLHAQDSAATDTDVVSDSRIVPPGSENGAVYREVVYIAELPSLDLPAGTQPVSYTHLRAHET